MLRPTVESVLSQLRAIMEKIGQDFLMDEALDLPTNLKRTASTKKHKKTSPFFRSKWGLKVQDLSSPEQFRHYMIAQLEEKVFDVWVKVDKSLKLDAGLSPWHQG